MILLYSQSQESTVVATHGKMEISLKQHSPPSSFFKLEYHQWFLVPTEMKTLLSVDGM